MTVKSQEMAHNAKSTKEPALQLAGRYFLTHTSTS
jgi:hypothetical protein